MPATLDEAHVRKLKSQQRRSNETRVGQLACDVFSFRLAEQKRGTNAFPNGFDLTLRPHKLKEPAKLKKPSLIFVNSMSDLFWDKAPPDYRDLVFGVMRDNPQHQFQVLTKRPEAMLTYAIEHEWPDNVWAGVTVENQRNDWRVDVLRDVSGPRIKFISAEPLIAPLDLTGKLSEIDWLIFGGESGSHMSKADIREERGLVRYDDVAKRWVPREDRVDWARTLRDNCVNAGVKFFCKQWGGPQSHSGGRVLDGRTWDEFPRMPVTGDWRDDRRKLPVVA